MIKDPVCSMQIDENSAKITSEYERKTYHFCSETCKEQFNTKPATYIDENPEGVEK